MHALPRTCLPLALLVLAACSRTPAPQAEAAPVTTPASAAITAPAGVAVPAPARTAVAPADERKCITEPHTDPNDKRPRCGEMGPATPAAPQAYRVVGGSGDPVDLVVCDIATKFVLDGKLFGVEFSGGVDGTYKFVRTPNVPGLSWKGGGRYHIEFPDGPDKQGTLITYGGGTTTAGSQSRTTSGGEHFTLTPVAGCGGAT